MKSKRVVELGAGPLEDGYILVADNDGKPFAILNTYPNSGRGLSLTNKDGTPFAILGSNENGPSLILIDGRSTSSMSAGEDGGTLDLTDKNGNLACALLVAADGTRGLTIVNKEGDDAVVAIGMNVDGNGQIRTFSAKGKVTSDTP